MAENRVEPSGSAGSPVEARSLGRIGYEAYGEAAGWKTWDGKPMPTWDGLGERVRGLWDAAAKAIATRPTPVEPVEGASGVEVSEIAAQRIVDDLADRRGVLDDVDLDDRAEIRDTLAGIIRAAYAERERMQTGDGSPMAALRAALAHVEDQDCGDNSCLFARREKRGGMRTNGGCRCVPYERGALSVGTVARIVKAARMVVARPQAPGVKL